MYPLTPISSLLAESLDVAVSQETPEEREGAQEMGKMDSTTIF